MNQIHFQSVQTELLIAMKGRRSSSQVSKKMNRKSNVVARWIAGSSTPSWVDFTEFADACHSNHKKILRDLWGYQGTSQDYSKLLRFLVGSKTAATIAKDLGVSRESVHNWLTGRTCPKFFVVLELLYRYQFILLDYVSALVTIEKIPSLTQRWTLDQKRRQAIYNNPMLEALIAILQLPAFHKLNRSSLDSITKYLRISVDQANSYIDELEKLKFIQWQGNHLYLIDNLLETRGSFLEAKRIRVFWAKEFIQFCDLLETPPEQSFSGYLVIGVSLDAEKKLKDEYFRFHTNIRTIVTQDKGPQNSVKVLTTNLIDFSDISKKISPVSKISKP